MGKILRIGFYAIGTFLLFFSSIIVGANFYKDSGVFDKEVIEVKKQAQEAESSSGKIIIDTEQKKETTKQSAEQTPSQSSVNNEKLVVEVINCTDKSGLAEEIRAMLEAKGYTVSAGNTFDSTQGTSKILIRKKGAKADVIRDSLKISIIKEELQPDSRFDITVIVGADFNP
ncbi:LytR cell envelope-related transcriptional attenuator [Ruminiclostridium sufflavum DSM 19573]|uniref:LytR cell envelope-related transcriptional attenuator n=1 Tax=Ruminiclostridium sufflavum DSM 19573 TaxID=1121337 RepID=A0A318XMR7_9FIRM|nr:LytR C-terminal domain-containing protein [Ruminiclostridium sufflavum]PYG86939.1 LytR cell envelope-related transcriptional attenuator [Ruminiclostridium sufflavum DSM 19573]